MIRQNSRLRSDQKEKLIPNKDGEPEEEMQPRREEDARGFLELIIHILTDDARCLGVTLRSRRIQGLSR